MRIFAVAAILFVIAFSFSLEFTSYNNPAEKKVSGISITLEPVYSEIYADGTQTSYYKITTDTKTLNTFFEKLKESDFRFAKNVQFKGLKIYEIVSITKDKDETIDSWTYKYSSSSQLDASRSQAQSFLLSFNHKWGERIYWEFDAEISTGSRRTIDPDVTACGTLSSANTVYDLLNNVNSTSGTCFTISASNITLNCNGNTINFSQAPSSSAYGIYTTATYTTINGCNIVVQNKTAGTSGTIAIGIRFTQTNLNVTNTNVTIDNGAYSYPIWGSATTSDNAYFDGVKVDTNSSDRAGGLWKLDAGNDNITIKNSIAISNNTNSLGSTGAVIYFVGGNGLYIDNLTTTSNRGIISDWVIQYGSLQAHNSQNIRIDNSNLKAVSPAVTYNVLLTNTNNTNITNTYVQTDLSNSIRIEYGYYNRIINVSSKSSTNAHMVLTPANYTVFTNITINNGSYGLYVGSGSWYNNFTNITFIGNHSTATVTERPTDSAGANQYNRFSFLNFSTQYACGVACFNFSSDNNFFNSTTGGNYYYNISSYDIYDSNSDGYGDGGSQYPANSSNTPGLFINKGTDYMPRVLTSLGYTPITSCPYDITSAGNYKIMNNLTSSTYCINITANNVNLDGQNFKINYSQGTSNNNYALKINGRNNVNASNVLIYQGNESSGTSGSHAVYFIADTNSRLDNLSINTNSSYGIWQTGSANSLYNISIIAKANYGIYSSSTYTNYSHMDINSTSSYGVRLITAENNIINNSRISSYSLYGMYVSANSRYNQIHNSNISSYSNIALITVSSDTLINEVNAFSYNSYGISLSASNCNMTNSYAESHTTYGLQVNAIENTILDNIGAISNNTAVQGIYMQSANNTILKNSNSKKLGGMNILSRSLNLTIFNNTFGNLVPYPTLTRISISDDSTVINFSNNIIYHNRTGTAIITTNNSVIANNVVYGNFSTLQGLRVASTNASYNVSVYNNYINSTSNSGIGISIGEDGGYDYLTAFHESSFYNNTAIAPRAMDGGTDNWHGMLVGTTNNSVAYNNNETGGLYCYVIKSNNNLRFWNNNCSYPIYIAYYMRGGLNNSISNSYTVMNLSGLSSRIGIKSDNNTLGTILLNPTDINWSNITFDNGEGNKEYTGIYSINFGNNLRFENITMNNATIKFINTTNSYLINNTLKSSTYTINLDSDSCNNQIYHNNITSDYWINNSCSSNTFNTTGQGNIYYLGNSTPSWNHFDIWSSTAATWADNGVDRPFNATITPSYWIGLGHDWHPYTLDFTATPDITPPLLNVSYPINGTIYNTTVIYLNYSAIDDVGIDKCWYNINVAGNTTISGCVNTTIVIVNGSNNFTMWINDTSGNLNFTTINFTGNISLGTANVTGVGRSGTGVIASDMLLYAYLNCTNGISNYSYFIDNGTLSYEQYTSTVSGFVQESNSSMLMKIADIYPATINWYVDLNCQDSAFANTSIMSFPTAINKKILGGDGMLSAILAFGIVMVGMIYFLHFIARGLFRTIVSFLIIGMLLYGLILSAQSLKENGFNNLSEMMLGFMSLFMMLISLFMFFSVFFVILKGLESFFPPAKNVVKSFEKTLIPFDLHAYEESDPKIKDK